MMSRKPGLHSLVLIAAFTGLCSAARAQSFSVFRYDDDVSALSDPAARKSLYEALKFIPLGSSPDRYLSLGGDDRERIEYSSDATLGARFKSPNAYEMHRLLVFGKLRLDDFQAFLQLGTHAEAGREPGPLPTDIDRADVQQAFLQYSRHAGPGDITVRFGRAEMSFDDGALISLRDGPNVRQVWDGFRSFYTAPQVRIDGFAVQPVSVQPGAFDDADLARQRLWGLHIDAAPATTAPIAFNAFYYGSDMPAVNFYPRTGAEQTQTFGLRGRVASGGFDSSAGVIGQSGSFAGLPVRAWSAHADAAWTFAAPWSPRVGLRADVLSGGDNSRGVIHTFNALYPNYAFSTEAAIEAPANLIQPALTLRATPAQTLEIEYKFEGLWRYSAKDAFYAAPLFPLAVPARGGQRFSGTEQQLRATWTINKFATLTAAYVHFEASAFLRAAHGASEDFGMTELAVRF